MLNTSLNTSGDVKAARDAPPSLSILCFQCVPDNLTIPAYAFLICVGVHPQSYRRVAMAQPFRCAYNVPAVRQGYGGGAMPIGYNKDKSEIPRKVKGNRVCLYSFSGKKRVKSTRKTVRQKG